MASQIFSPNYIVGAYATSPNLLFWDEKSEKIYFNSLKKISSIRGLELPFWGQSLHPFDDQWLITNLDPKWENVLTCVPGTMKSIKSNSYFGLASLNEDSRQDAISFYKVAFDCVNNLKKQLGNKSLVAIYITSSPFQKDKKIYADKERFILSLMELVSWDWGNTRILVEHCDAYTKYNPDPHKGFLSLIDEISAIKNVNQKCESNIGIVINWGRSTIELRDVDGPIKHINYALKNNVLSGLMFSGTTAKNNNLYGSWSDLHMPPGPFPNCKYFESQSLMSFENIKKTLASCNLNSLPILGLKLLAMPNSSSIEKRIAINKDSMFLLNQAKNEIAKG